jgi:hypothetical protein
VSWTPDEHKERHELLHKMLDELLADFIMHTKKGPSASSIKELMQWSYVQTLKPTDGNWHPFKKKKG